MGIALKTAYLTIPVSNFQRSIEWYGEHFGFKVILEDPYYIELQNESGIKILLQQNEHNLNSHIVYPDGALQSSYGFVVDDAESVYQYLIAKGVKVEQLFEYQGKSFSFYDPDGNFIEVWSFPTNK